MNPLLRLIVFPLGAALVVAAILHFAMEHSRLSASEATLQGYADSSDFSNIRSRCQADPVNLGPLLPSGPLHDGPTIEVYAYDGGLQPAIPTSPPFSEDLADNMRGKISAFHTYHSPEGRGSELGIATPWRNSKCALMLLRLPPRPGDMTREVIWVVTGALLAALAIWFTVRVFSA